ncbi:MAG: FG-GAP repeat domain-containing protein, partial [Marinicella sp.]
DGYVSLAADKFSDTEDVSILTQSFFEQRNLLYAPDFTNNETVVWEDFPEGASDVEYGDVNGDGTTDLVASSFKNDKVHWYNGLDGTHQVIADQIDGAAEVVVVDLDDDGLVDVLSAASFANKFYWHRNLGNQQFDTILIFDGALFANGLTVVDVNGDGRLDVVGTSGTDDSVRWFDRNGVVFTAHLIDDQNDAPNEVKPYDMDSDGDIDLVVPNYFSNDVFIYYNDGLGNFSAVRIASDLVRVDSTALVDINSDGLIDILASVSGEDHLVQLINQTGGVYKQELLIDGLENPGTIQLDDAVSPVFLQVKDYTNSIESVTVYAVGLLDESISDMVFEFANAFFNTNHVFMTTFIDEIFHHGFEN